MQTFLPYPSFSESAACLDRQRLGKQRVEVKQLLRALRGQTKGWRNHPAAKMWEGYEPALAAYGIAICMEWRKRGYNDSLMPEFLADLSAAASDDLEMLMPPFIGDEDFHRSHQSNLIRKNPDHYRPIFGGDVPDDLSYVWITKEN